jgi:periplasmic protein TonB
MKDNRLKPNYEIRRRPESNLQNYYTILLETGLILALLILTALVRIEISTVGTEEIVLDEQEIVEMEEIVQTRQIEQPPPPPRPPSPVPVPNDEIIEDIDIMIDAEMDFGSTLDMPPPPPQQEEEEEPEEGFFIIVEQMPELIGGLAALQADVRYPERALRANIEGRVIVQFIVNERGEVENPQVIRGIGGGCDEEAIRVVKQAKFKPGMQRGRPVRVQYNLPVIFRIRS